MAADEKTSDDEEQKQEESEDEQQRLNEDSVVPRLTQAEHEEADHLTSVTPLVVHEAIRRQGDEELKRPVSALAWSGLAAGMSMGFSFLAEALLRKHIPDAPWRPLITHLGYPLGYLIVIVGRQQLFTENTLTAIIPLLAKRDLATFLAVLRLWSVVLVANLAGAHLFAWVVTHTPILKPEYHPALMQLATEAADVGFAAALLRGIFAGWLIAMVVWMLSAVDTGPIAIIVILTYVVGLAGLTHVIAGSVEVLYLVMSGAKGWISYLGGYLVPTLIGNIIGGVALVSALNHAQVVSGSEG
jgi:formate/nitrite transporter FocA (FNT family)